MKAEEENAADEAAWREFACELVALGQAEQGIVEWEWWLAENPGGRKS